MTRTIRPDRPAARLTGALPDAAVAALAEFRQLEDERRSAAYSDFFSPVTAQVAASVVAGLGRAGGRVVDVGSGDGTLALELGRAGWQVVALDRSRAMAARSRAAMGAALVGDAERLPVADATVVGVVSAFVLPHLTELPAVLAEMHRVLMPGGRLVLVTWAASEQAPFTGLVTDLVLDRSPADAALAIELSRRTDNEYLCGLLAAAGFTGIETDVVPATARMGSTSDWWAGLVEASCGLASLLQAQPPEVWREIRTAFDAAAAGYEMPGGSVVVPASALLVSGTRADGAG